MELVIGLLHSNFAAMHSSKITVSRKEIANNFQSLQDTICTGLESLESLSRFREDAWDRPGGGGGRSRVITQGQVFEKGGVNFSEVHGEIPTILHGQVNSNAQSFFASGVSLVLHPLNPMVPIVHMNVRYFETDKGDAWFGGGIDLTPIYINELQAKHFHQTLKTSCDAFDLGFYPKYKNWADDYFFIRHRNETRGIGGVFFDYLRPDDHHSLDFLFEFVKKIGDTFLPAYLPIVKENTNLPYSEEQKKWQYLRRGRYVEFNLVYDRGTRFGLETGGRTESILMSLPENASWLYDYHPAKGSQEDMTLSFLKKGINWA